MSREDWEVFDAMKQERKAKRAARRAAFDPGPEWTRYSDTHYMRMLNGDRLDYWPGPMKWQYRGRYYTGDVFGFIRNREDPGPADMK